MAFLRTLDALEKALPVSEPHAESPFLALDEVTIIASCLPPRIYNDSFQAQAGVLIASCAIGGWALMTVLTTWGSDAVQVFC